MFPLPKEPYLIAKDITLNTVETKILSVSSCVWGGSKSSLMIV